MGAVCSASVLLDLVEQLQRLAALAIHLVDERDDGDVAQAADLEQLARARLDAARRVDHHDRGIHRRQRAIGVIGEVLVARRVQQVEHRPAVLERHHRGDDGDAARPLDRHPVRAGVAPVALGLDLAGELDGAAEQQQLLGQRGLAGVGMGDDGKRAPPRDLLRQRARCRFRRRAVRCDACASASVLSSIGSLSAAAGASIALFASLARNRLNMGADSR